MVREQIIHLVTHVSKAFGSIRAVNIDLPQTYNHEDISLREWHMQTQQ